MASFCSNCGFPLGAGVAFCSKCGTRQSSVASSPIAQSQPSSTPAKGSGAGLKIALILVGMLAFFGIAAVGTVIYLGHRVKNAVVERAKEYGVDLPPASTTSSRPVRHRAICDFISKPEASRLLGEPIERAVAQDGACVYIGPPGLAAALADQTAKEMMQKAQSGGSGGDLVSSMSRITGSAAAVNGEAPLLSLMIDYDGGPQWTALTASSAIFGQIPGAKLSVDVPNLGDHARRMVPLGLNVLKGNTIIRIIPGPIPDADAKTIAVARAVLDRL